MACAKRRRSGLAGAPSATGDMVGWFDFFVALIALVNFDFFKRGSLLASPWKDELDVLVESMAVCGWNRIERKVHRFPSAAQNNRHSQQVLQTERCRLVS
jgi:hypothetical protein